MCWVAGDRSEWATGDAVPRRMVIRVVCWNVAQRVQPVAELLYMDADVALRQEAGPGILEELANAGGDVAVSHQDPWEP